MHQILCGILYHSSTRSWPGHNSTFLSTFFCSPAPNLGLLQWGHSRVFLSSCSQGELLWICHRGMQWSGLTGRFGARAGSGRQEVLEDTMAKAHWCYNASIPGAGSSGCGLFSPLAWLSPSYSFLSSFSFRFPYPENPSVRSLLLSSLSKSQYLCLPPSPSWSIYLVPVPCPTSTRASLLAPCPMFFSPSSHCLWIPICLHGFLIQSVSCSSQAPFSQCPPPWSSDLQLFHSSGSSFAQPTFIMPPFLPPHLSHFGLWSQFPFSDFLSNLRVTII